MVVHIYSLGINSSITEVVDLESKDSPTPALYITQAYYDQWVHDQDMTPKETTNGVEWIHNPVRL